MWSLRLIAIFLTFAAFTYVAPYPYDPTDTPVDVFATTTTPCPPFDLKQKIDNVKEKVKQAGKAIGKTFQDVKVALKNKLDKITGKTPPPTSPGKSPPFPSPVPPSYPPTYYEETTVVGVSDSYGPSDAYKPESGFEPVSIPEVGQTYSKPDQPAVQQSTVQLGNEPLQNVASDDVIAQPVDNFYRISESKS